MTSKNNHNSLAKNTLLLYIRTFFTLIISLYISRVVLSELGVVDYGIYNVVGGFVALFSMISGSLTAAISRYLTYELGKGNLDKLKIVFSVSVTIQSILALAIFILAEVVGVWFLNYEMNIPADRMYAANWVLQCSIFTFIINIISVPYNASIISHEKMGAFAYISILEAILKLSSVLLLSVFLRDKLIVYSVLLMVVAILIRIIYTVYCRINFEECKYRFIYDVKLIKEMIAFAGWNMIGAASGVLRDQGVNIVINIFNGPVVNAARGIAMQVSNAINQFVQSFMIAINPRITKSYAVGDYNKMNELIFKGSRFSLYLLMFMAFPVLIETKYLLELWLVNVPDHAVLFTQLIVIMIMTESLSYTLVTTMLATGNIRNYQIVVGGLNLLNLPLSYILLKLGHSPEYTVLVAIVISIIGLFVRAYMLKQIVPLSIGKYLKSVILNILFVFVIALVFPVFIHYNVSYGFFRLFLVSFSSTIALIVCILYIGCNKSERVSIFMIIKKKIMSWKS